MPPEIQTFLSSPYGQVILAIGGFLIAKRFPAFQSIAWVLLDAFKVPRPNIPGGDPVPSPAVPAETPNHVSLVSSLVSSLLAAGRHAEAHKIVEVAASIDAAAPVEGGK